MRDQLNSVPTIVAQRVAFEILDVIQKQQSPAARVAGAALLFALLVRRFNVDPREALLQADRRIADSLKDPHLRAIRMYLDKELPG